MVFRWRADDGPLLLLFGSSPPFKKNDKIKKKMIKLKKMDLLWQNFLDPRMASIGKGALCIAKGPMFLQAEKTKTDQSVWRRIIAVRTCQFRPAPFVEYMVISQKGDKIM